MPTPKVLIGSYPFGPEATALLEAHDCELVRQPHRRKLTRDELIEMLPGSLAVVASTEPYDAGVLDAAPSLKLIARTGVGMDSVDLEAARARGVAVAWTPEGPSDSVAELTVGLTVTLFRHVLRADRAIRAGGWERLTGGLVRTRTVGIYGFGRIGTRIARLLKPFGCRLLVTDIDPSVAEAAKALEVELVSPEVLLAESDLVTLHVPLTPLTDGLVDREFLGQMRPGALLINTARGPIVDEEALLAALDSGALGGAAIDVFCEEPYTGPLASREDVILTAHMGSCSKQGRLDMELGAARAVAAFLTGEPLPERVV